MPSIFDADATPTDDEPEPDAGQIRAGDGERSESVRALNKHFEQGRLNAEEFAARSAAAAAAVTRGELRTAMAGLPGAQSTLQDRLLEQERAAAEASAAAGRQVQTRESRTAVANQLLKQLVLEALPILMTRKHRKLLEVSAEFKKPLFGKRGYLNPKFRCTAGRTVWTNSDEFGKKWAFSEDGGLFFYRAAGNPNLNGSFSAEQLACQEFAKSQGFADGVALTPETAFGEPTSRSEYDPRGEQCFFLDPSDSGRLLFGRGGWDRDPKEAEVAFASFVRGQLVL